MSLIYPRSQQLKSGKTEELESKNRYALEVSVKSGESVESVLKKKKGATVGKICRKRF